jgi:hypothetical protein
MKDLLSTVRIRLETEQDSVLVETIKRYNETCNFCASFCVGKAMVYFVLEKQREVGASCEHVQNSEFFLTVNPIFNR